MCPRPLAGTSAPHARTTTHSALTSRKATAAAGSSKVTKPKPRPSITTASASEPHAPAYARRPGVDAVDGRPPMKTLPDAGAAGGGGGGGGGGSSPSGCCVRGKQRERGGPGGVRVSAPRPQPLVGRAWPDRAARARVRGERKNARRPPPNPSAQPPTNPPGRRLAGRRRRRPRPSCWPCPRPTCRRTRPRRRAQGIRLSPAPPAVRQAATPGPARRPRPPARRGRPGPARPWTPSWGPDRGCERGCVSEERV
jgi:hypothetical protein